MFDAAAKPMCIALLTKVHSTDADWPVDARPSGDPYFAVRIARAALDR